LEKDGTIGRFHLDFGLKRKKIWISWTWIQLGFSKDPDLFKKPCRSLGPGLDESIRLARFRFS
jgi:hypothetical protein